MAEGDAQKPLYGVVLCGTGLDQEARTRIGPTGAELGATHKLDLTSEVTHLLCGSITSEKYRHIAKHRPDVTVLLPEWLYAIRDAWMQGGDVDVQGITRQYRMPTFQGLNICVTGFNEITQRSWLEETTSRNGAKYHGDLTKAVSHLVAAKPEGAKYQRAKDWGITVVSLQWFEQSVARGMVLSEPCFDPLLPADQQGKGSYEPRPYKSNTGKRVKVEEDDTQNSRRKMRRTASTRLHSQSQTLWQDLSVQEEDSVKPLDDSWTQSVDARKDDPPTIKTQPVDDTENKTRPSLPREASSENSTRGLFSGWICMAYGYDQPATTITKLKHYLSENGAQVTDSLTVLESSEAPCKALILPAAWVADPSRDVPKVSPDIKLLTEWWVERCILYKKALDPDKDILSNALFNLPKDLFENLAVSTSGIGNDVRYFATIVRAAGGEYLEDLGRRTTILIHDLTKPDLDKPVYCADRNIDVVKPEWFFQTLRDGKLSPIYPYYLPNSVCDAITRIRESRRKEKRETEAAQPVKADGESGHARERKNVPSSRLTGFKRQARTHALALIRPLPPAVASVQPAERPKPLTPISQNSQDRSPSHSARAGVDDPPHLTPVELNNATSPPSSTRHPSPDKENLASPSSFKPTATSTGSATSFVTAFLARRQNSASAPADDTSAASKGRKRTLGRVLSGSTIASFRHSPAVASEVEAPPEDGGEATTTPLPLEMPPEPSQQVCCEAPGAAEHRRILGRRMGVEVEEEPELVGERCVKDVEPKTTARRRGARDRGP